MSDISKATSMIFQETGKYMVLGLTGRTGSGCTTVSEILAKKNLLPPKKSKIYNSDNDKRKYKAVYQFINHNWLPFISIQVRAVITEIILNLNYDDFIDLVVEVISMNRVDVVAKLSDFKENYEEAHLRVNSFNLLDDNNLVEREKKISDAPELYLNYLPDFCDKIKTNLKDKINIKAYTDIYQRVGDNIRASGVANSSEFNEKKLFTIPKKIKQLVKAIKSQNPEKGASIVIDAIRNPFEAIYFQQRYSDFYLIAINTPNDKRYDHLRTIHKFSDQQIEELDNKEYPKKLIGKDIYISQNIQKCIEIADIHINNPDRSKDYNNDLTSQLMWYLSLIKHPGLVTPTSIERSMQLAYTAKLNSGCISRQVGAVVTDSSYSVKAVGWNSTPEGQTPCVLRSAKDLLESGDEFVYSQYERTDDNYQKIIKETFSSVIGMEVLKGRNCSYCFKDLQNAVEDEKNQVHTRSLHAEENAFLQISKYGGIGIKGGILFSTASPCELCSKKAYQLGISKVVYIDPYPGISKKHIISVGNNMPIMTLFSGAIGHAYHKLYQPIMAYKDELQMLTGFKIPRSEKNKVKDLEVEVKRLKQELEKCKHKA